MFEYLTLGKNTKESQWTELSRFFMIEETMYFCMMNFLPLRCGVQWSQTQTYNCIQVNPVRYCREPVVEQNPFWRPSCTPSFFLEFGMMVTTTNVFVWWNKNGLKWHIYISLAIIRMEFSSNKPPLVIFFRFFTMTDHDTRNGGLMAGKDLRIWKLRGWKN